DRRLPTPDISRGLGSRQTVTSAPVTRAASHRRPSSSAKWFLRAKRRRAAAASAEPPPRPAATGSRFDRTKRPYLRPPTRSASALAALRTRLSASTPDEPAVGPLTVSISRGPAASGSA